MKFKNFDGLNDQFMKNFNQMINTINSNWVINFNEQKKCMILFCKCINHYNNYKRIQKIVKKYKKYSRIKYWKISTNININDSLTDNKKSNTKGMKNRNLRIIPQNYCDEEECLNSIHKKLSKYLPFFKLIEKNKTKNFIKKEKIRKKSRFYDNLKKNTNNISNYDKNYLKCIENLIKERSSYLETIKTNQKLIGKLYEQLKE